MIGFLIWLWSVLTVPPEVPENEQATGIIEVRIAWPSDMQAKP
jgi:hypothetical protein